jgi:hypothetical protein
MLVNTAKTAITNRAQMAAWFQNFYPRILH